MLMAISKVQVVAIIGCLFFLALVVEAVRRRHLKEAYSLLWLILGLIFLGLAVWRSGLEYISSIVGIYYAPSMLFLFMLCAQFLILFQYSMIMTKRAEEAKRLAQELALLEERVRKLEGGKPGPSGK